MATNKESIYWFPELTEEAQNMTDEWLAELFAPIIRRRLEEQAKVVTAHG